MSTTTIRVWQEITIFSPKERVDEVFDSQRKWHPGESGKIVDLIDSLFKRWYSIDCAGTYRIDEYAIVLKLNSSQYMDDVKFDQLRELLVENSELLAFCHWRVLGSVTTITIQDEVEQFGKYRKDDIPSRRRFEKHEKARM